MGTESANILSGIVRGSSSVGATDYTGNLIINENATLQLNNYSYDLEDHLPSDTSSNIFMYEGSKLYVQCQTIFDIYNPIVLFGTSTIQHHYGSDQKTYYSHISGNAGLKFDMQAWGNTEEAYLSPPTPNTYTGGTTIISRRNEFHITTDGALGTGDVKIGGTSGDAGSVKFSGTTTDIIDDDAELWMNDYGILDLGSNNETVRLLLIDGVVQNPTGYPETWGSTSSGANQTNNTYFKGTGVITVTGGADVSPPWPNRMTFEHPPSGNGTTAIHMTATTATDINTVEYLFENVTSGTNSGYQSSTIWQETGLTPGSSYSYRVKAKDSLGNETDWSLPYKTNTSIFNTFDTDNAGWDAGSSWDLGTVPTGNESAVVGANLTVDTNSSNSSDYEGNLYFEQNTTLNLDQNAQLFRDHLPTNDHSTIYFSDNVYIYVQNNTTARYILPFRMVLNGDFHFKTHYNNGYTWTGPISGIGALTLSIGAWQETFTLNGPNSYRGGTIINANGGNKSGQINANVNYCLGTGDVTMNNGTTLILNGSTSDVIDDDASLYLNGSATMNLNSNDETVKFLYLDGVVQKVGTYGSTSSSAQFTDNNFFSGSGVLTVLEPKPKGAFFRLD